MKNAFTWALKSMRFKRQSQKLFLLVFLLFYSFESYGKGFVTLTCLESGNTSLVWSSAKSSFNTSGEIKPGTSKLKLRYQPKQKKAKLIADSTADLILASESATSLTFIELTNGGSVVSWVLMSAPTDSKKLTLFSLKAYDLLGPASFTTLYECSP